MIGSAALAAAGTAALVAAGWAPSRAPALSAVIVATSRGEARVPVTAERGHPVLPVALLTGLLPLTPAIDGDWATVGFAGEPFRFLLGAPLVVADGAVLPLAGGAYVARDTLFVPLQWLTEYVPRRFHEGYRFDPIAGRFEELGLAPVVRTASAPARNPLTGLRLTHVVTIDAGHGGVDPGNPCLFCPRGVQEKDITLGIAKRVQRELERRAISVTMTRSKDSLIELGARAGYCRDACELFVSLHVDALDPAPGYQRRSGVHSYFLGEARTADAQRVAAMENSALRYESGGPRAADDPRTFILKSLQANEMLRESALLAELVQGEVGDVHPGGDRGVTQGPWMVLNTATRPAILLEMGFGTNRSDAQFISSAKGQDALAGAIVTGIVEYLRRYEAKTLAGQP